MTASLINKFLMSADKQSMSGSPRPSGLTIAYLGLCSTSLCGAIACSSGYEEAPVGEFANPPGAGANDSRNSGGYNSNGEGGAGGETMGSGGRLGFGGAVTGPDPDPTIEPLCPADAEWGSPQKLSTVSTDGEDERLLAISPDELTIVFQRGDVAFVADRSKTTEDFSPAQVLTVPDGYDVELGVTLTPDGLTVVFTHEDSSGFGEVSRNSRGEAFSLVADEARYLVLNSLYPMAGIKLSHPVIAGSDLELWWVETRSETSVWFASYEVPEIARGSQVGCNELGCTLMLDGYEGQKKLLTGLSSDLLTVFVVDDVIGQEARFRSNPEVDAGFFESVALEPRLDVQSNASCTRLYYSSGGDIVFDSR